MHSAKKPFKFDVEPEAPRVVQARVGSRVIGKASAWLDWDGRFCILNVVVRADYRRRGVARAMYQALETEAGQLLLPAVSLSADGFEFWKRFRPESVAQDLRHRQSDLLGRKVQANNSWATIVSVGAHSVTARYDPDTARFGMETTLLARNLDQALGA